MQQGDVIQERYELERVIGEGGMATVWRAEDRRLGRKVAVKALAPGLAQDPEYMVRFFSEAQSVARISNPHVIGILDFGEHDDHPYLVMDHVDGGSAADLVGESILPERAAEIVAEAASAAGAAHARGIVHRDIKPGNILLTRDGRVRLADFGIATSAGAEKMTATGQAIGSPHYISPEQVSGASASPASDVYSLGIVLYELITGRKPFHGESVTKVAIAHVDELPDPPSTHVPDLDPELERLVLKCLAKDPSARFADGAELAAALAALGEGTYVDEDEIVPVVPRLKRPAIVGAVALTAVVLLTAAILAFGSMMRDTDVAAAGPIETQQPEKKGRAKPSPSPATEAVTSVVPTPTPTPTPRRRAERREEDASATEQETTESVAEPEPTPTAEPEPTPEPTSSPADSGAESNASSSEVGGDGGSGSASMTADGTEVAG